MSCKGLNVETLFQRDAEIAELVVQEPQKQWFVPLCSPLWLCLIVAFAVRVLLIIHTNGVIDGDEALVGIQAQHILRGELPIYFYGIPYFGSLEAYLVSLVFAIAGSSVWALRAEPTLLALIIVWLTWRFAAVLADGAQLPAYARQRFMCIAALYAAVFPLYDAVLEMRTFGGYVETFVLMLLLLYSVWQLTEGWRRGVSEREIALRCTGMGLIIGVGMWVDPLIISAIVAVALWVAGFCLREIMRLRGQCSASLWQSSCLMLKRLRWSLVAMMTSVVGCAPAIYWGARHQWQNVTYMLNLGNNMSALAPDIREQYPDRLALTGGLVKLYSSCVVPRVIGGALPAESGITTLLHTFTLFAGVMCTLAVVVLVSLSFCLHRSLLIKARQLVSLPLLFGVITACFFCTSTAAVQGLGCERDLAGRYATPLMLALPFIFATVFTLLSMYIQSSTSDVVARRPRPFSAGYEGRRKAQYISMKRFSQKCRDRFPFLKCTGRDTYPNVMVAKSLPVKGRPPSWLAQGALFTVLLIYFLAQAALYGLTDAGQTFQSPYCTHAPANNDPIIAYLEQHHIRYAWAPNWVGFPIVFKMDGKITIADPQPVMKHMIYFNRFPADVQAVLHAERSSFIVMVRHADRHPKLLQMFDKQRVTYSAVFFPGQAETDILVVTPISRSVSPFEAEAYFGIFHCSS